MTERPQNRHLKSYPKLPDGTRPTKALRFTLPVEQAAALEGMSKAERDALVLAALLRR